MAQIDHLNAVRRFNHRESPDHSRETGSTPEPRDDGFYKGVYIISTCQGQETQKPNNAPGFDKGANNSQELEAHGFLIRFTQTGNPGNLCLLLRVFGQNKY